MLERFTQKAVQSISLAQAESRRLGYPSVGYEQLMLGLMGTENSAAAQFLQAAGVNLDSARNLVVKLIAQGSGHVPLEIPLTTNTQQALQQSLTKARQQGANFSVGTHHLLWGLLQQSDRQAALVLETLGLDLQHLTHKLDRAISKSYLTLVDDEQECTSERTDFSCDAIAIRLASSMLAWVEPRRLGVIATKSVRFRNSDGRVLLPDVSFISQERLMQQGSHPDTQLVPELVAMIIPSTDFPSPLCQDLERSVNLGQVQVGLLINSNKSEGHVITLRRPSAEPRGADQQQLMINFLDSREMLEDEDTLRIPELLPGWELPVSALWRS